MSMNFDPNAFLDKQTDQASERRAPLPAVDYNATIKDVQAKTWQSRDKVDEATGMLKSGIRFEVSLDLDLSPQTQELCGITKMTLTDGFAVDMNESKTALDYSKGKNNRLRQYREATDLNVAGQPFMPRMLAGRLVRVRVTHEEYPQGSGTVVERVGAIAKAV